MMMHFEVAGCGINVDVDGGVVSTNAICSPHEVVNDVISVYNLEFSGLPCCEFMSLLASMIFQKIVIIHLCNALTTVRLWSTFRGQEAKMSND